MNHNISLTFHDQDVDVDSVIDILANKLEAIEICNSTISTVTFFIDLDTETVLEALTNLLEDLIDASIIQSVSVTIDLQIVKGK
jgi:catabolite regulation protein CreA